MEEMIRAIIQALGSLRIQYVVIGGIAASIWGRPRMTMDADIVIVAPLEKLPSLLELLEGSGFQVGSATAKKLRSNLPAKIRYGKRLSVDLRMASYSLDRQALKRALTIKLFGIKLAIASAEDIIAYKVARFDDLDKADIKSIILRQKRKLDFRYLAETGHKLTEETGDKQIADNLDVALSWL